MGHFVTDEVNRIDLDGGEWVDIKSQMNYGDQLKLMSAYAITPVKGQRVSAESADLETGSIALLFINIKAWSFRDGSGQPVPINEENIRRLNVATANLITEEVGKRNPLP